MEQPALPLPAAGAAATRPSGRWLWVLFGVLCLPLCGYGALEGWSHWQEQKARNALAAERFDEAQQHIERALKVRARSTTLHILAARIARYRGDYLLAVEHLDRCGQIDGMTEPLQLEWLLLRCQRGEVDELAPALQLAVQRAPPAPPAIREALAAVYIRQARYDEALKCLNRWIELDPNSVRALDSRGWLFNQFEGWNPAIADYQRALELQPARS